MTPDRIHFYYSTFKTLTRSLKELEVIKIPSSLCLSFIYIYIYFSTVQYGDPVTLTCIYTLFSHMFHHKGLDRVPSAKQQDPFLIFTANIRNTWCKK